MFMFKTNEPIKVIHLQKLTNQLMLNAVLVIEIASNSFSESMNVLIEKNWDMSSQEYISTRFH